MLLIFSILINFIFASEPLCSSCQQNKKINDHKKDSEVNSIECTTKAWIKKSLDLLKPCFGKVSSESNVNYESNTEPKIKLNVYGEAEDIKYWAYTWNLSFNEFKKSFGNLKWKILKREIWKADLLDIFDLYYNEEFKIAVSVLPLERPRIRAIYWGYDDLNKIKN